MDKQLLLDNYEKVLKRIDEIDKEKKVKLLLATKTQNTEDINFLIERGVKYIGENRVNELLDKYDSYNKNAELHFIGTLQKNKVKYICDKVSLIHSVDSYDLAKEINKQSLKIGKIMNILVEINIGREESKSGIMPDDTENFVKSLKDFQNIKVVGLMTMAPRCENKNDYYKYFGETKKIFDSLFSDNPEAILSMGMSESYEYAIECGSNMVRLGSAVFGERNR